MSIKTVEDRSLIGIDLGATNLRVARIENDQIVQLETENITKSDNPADLMNQITRLIKKARTDQVSAIGIGVPSVVDIEKGIVYDVQNIPGWDKVPVKRILESDLDLPVYVNNDANCFVLGEKYFGKGLGYDSIVGLTLGSGFGSGLILDGHLYAGKNCGAGEVGMLPYRDSIFEHYCSGMFFEREFGIAGDEVFEKAIDGQSDAKIMYESFGTHLGNGMKAVMYAYDPQMIILGGTIRKAYRFFGETMHRAMEDFAYTNSLEHLKIEISERNHISVLGAAALVYNG